MTWKEYIRKVALSGLGKAISASFAIIGVTGFTGVFDFSSLDAETWKTAGTVFGSTLLGVYLPASRKLLDDLADDGEFDDDYFWEDIEEPEEDDEEESEHENGLEAYQTETTESFGEVQRGDKVPMERVLVQEPPDYEVPEEGEPARGVVIDPEPLPQENPRIDPVLKQEIERTVNVALAKREIGAKKT